jgi:biopolymer transport protein ExbD
VAIAATAAADPRLPGVETPKVPYGLNKLPATLGTIAVATPTGVVIDGKAIVSIRNGHVEPAEKEGGSLGIKIPRVTAFVEKQLELQRAATAGQGGGPGVPFLLAIDKRLPYGLFIELMFSIKAAGVRDFSLIGQGSDLGVVPVRLLERPFSLRATKDAPLGLAVAVTKDKLILWSLSGLEGTLSTPKLSVGRTDTAKLALAVAEITKRRFPDKRAEADRSIMIMADSAVPMQDVLTTIVAVRTTADDRELFPDVVFSAGFE